MTVSRALAESVRNPEGKRLARIREAVPSMPQGLTWAVSDGNYLLEWIDPVSQERETLATFTAAAPRELVEQFAALRDDTVFLLSLIDRAAAKVRELRDGGPPAGHRRSDERPTGRTLKQNGDYAANCAMLCDDAGFRRFLESMHGLETDSDKEWLVGKVRELVCVESRKELNTDDAAARRWLDLVEDFNSWKASQ